MTDAILIYLIGSTADICSSVGRQELNPLLRNRAGYFVLWRGLVAKVLCLVVLQTFAPWLVGWAGLAAFCMGCRNVIGARCRAR